MLWLGFTLMNVGSCGCLLIVPIIGAQNSKSGMTCQQWPPPHKTCYRSSKVVNCLGTISNLLPPLFHTRYTNFIASLPKTAPTFYLHALYCLANLSKNTYKVLLVSYLFQVKRTLSVRRVVSVGDRTWGEYLFCLQLLAGFDTLTYRKRLQLIPYTCGLSRPFSGAAARKLQRGVNILVCACLLYH